VSDYLSIVSEHTAVVLLAVEINDGDCLFEMKTPLTVGYVLHCLRMSTQLLASLKMKIKPSFVDEAVTGP
jgi:hypothetical protein